MQTKYISIFQLHVPLQKIDWGFNLKLKMQKLQANDIRYIRILSPRYKHNIVEYTPLETPKLKHSRTCLQGYNMVLLDYICLTVYQWAFFTFNTNIVQSHITNNKISPSCRSFYHINRVYNVQSSLATSASQEQKKVLLTWLDELMVRSKLFSW